MKDIFKRIEPAENVRFFANEREEMKYLAHESLIVDVIASRIHNAASKGNKSCSINFTNELFDMISASKVAEHVAAPMNELGYRVKLVCTGVILFSWNENGEEDYHDSIPF